MKYLFLIIAIFWGGVSLSQTILLKDATLINGDTATPITKTSILIKDGKIVKVAKEIKDSNITNVINCEGKYVVPGLFDAHVHLGTLDLSNIEKAHAVIDSITTNMVLHGITTVRDMAGNAPFLKSYKDRVGLDKPIPDIFYAAQFAGPGYFKLLGSGRKEEKFGVFPWERAVSDTTDIEKAVIDAKKAGVTGIKIYADLSKESVDKIVNAAFKHGLLSWSHSAVFPIKPSVVAADSVMSMSHANDLVFEQLSGDSIDVGTAWQQVYKGLKADMKVMDPLLLTMKRKNTFLDPTLYLSKMNNLVNAPIIAKRAYELGLKFVTGTDWFYPTTPKEAFPLLEEVKLLNEEVGMSKREIIQAATKNSALVTGLTDRGVIQIGKRADLLVLDNDPLDRLENLFDPEVVIQNGKIVVRKDGENVRAKSYDIRGSISTPIEEGAMAYLYVYNPGIKKIDSTIIQDGKFHFKGTIEKPYPGSIRISKLRKSAGLILEPGTFAVQFAEGYNGSVIGGKENAIKKAYENDVRPYYDSMVSLGRLYEEADIPERVKIGEKMNRINEEVNFYKKQYLESYPSSVAVLEWLRPDLAVMNYLELKELREKFSSSLSYLATYQELKERYRQKEEQYIVGEFAPQIRSNTVDGKAFKLSDHKGKFVLLDFWASWCAPCRATNKKLIPVYNEYKSKGFEIISFSMDEDKGLWKDAIHKDGIPWLQVSDLKSLGESEVAKTYNISALPTAYLLDEKGMVIGQNLSVNEIKNILEKKYHD